MQTAQQIARRLTDSPSLASLLRAPVPDDEAATLPEDGDPDAEKSRATTLTTLAATQSTAVSLPIGPAQPKIHAPIPAFRIMKDISALAIFMAGSYTFSFSLIAFGVMAGRLDDGKDNVGAAGLVISYLNMVIMTTLAGFYCVSAYLSEKWGDLQRLNDETIPLVSGVPGTRAEQIKAVKADISRIFKNCAIIGILPAALAILALVLSETVLKGLNQPVEQAELAATCLSIISLGVVFYFIRMYLEQIIFPFKKSRDAMFIGLASFFTGVGLAYAIGFTAGLGLPGVSLGFALEPLLTSIGFGLYVLLHKVFKEFNFFNNFTFGKEDITQIKTLVKGGWPITLTIGLEVIAMQVLTSIAGRMGSDALDAYTIASRPYFTALPIVIAFGQTIRQEVGRLYGQKDFLNMSRTAYYGLLATVLILLPFCITVAAYPELLITIMTGGEANEQVREMVNVMARIFALGVVLPEIARYDWLQVLTGIAFYEQNMKGQVVPVIFSVTSLLVSVIVAWLLEKFTDAGIYSVPGCLAAGITVGATFLGPQWLSKIISYEQKARPRNTGSGNINTADNETTPLLGDRSVDLLAAGVAPPPSATYVPGKAVSIA